MASDPAFALPAFALSDTHGSFPRLRGRLGWGRLERDGAKLQLARTLRQSMTDAEQRLWHGLRYRQLNGARFRRQVPIGPYVVDFLCVGAMLVVEVDGGQHDDSGHDARRDAFLRDQGYRVLRFRNHEVLVNPEAVLLTLHGVLEERPHPSLPPQAGEGAKAEHA